MSAETTVYVLVEKPVQEIIEVSALTLSNAMAKVEDEHPKYDVITASYEREHLE